MTRSTPDDPQSQARIAELERIATPQHHAWRAAFRAEEAIPLAVRRKRLCAEEVYCAQHRNAPHYAGNLHHLEPDYRHAALMRAYAKLPDRLWRDPTSRSQLATLHRNLKAALARREDAIRRMHLLESLGRELVPAFEMADARVELEVSEVLVTNIRASLADSTIIPLRKGIVRHRHTGVIHK